MRFMMLMIPKVYQPGTPADQRAGEGFAPPADAIAKMMKYNEELAKTGALVALDGLHPIARGARVAFPQGKPRVTDGPFTESKEVLGGFWIINVKSKEEAVEWARRVPAEEGDVIEVREIFEIADFPADAQKAADSPTVKSLLEKQRQ